MTVDLVIKNGKIVSAEGISEGGIAIDDGKIVAIAKEPNLPQADKVIDAKGFAVMPGAIDPHSLAVTVSRSWPMLTMVGPKSGSTSCRCDCEPYLAAVRANWRMLIAARTWRARSRLDAGWTA